MKERILKLKDIGDVRFVKSKRARHINITLKPFKGVRVAVPQQVSYDAAEHFLMQKVQWIKSHLAKIESIENRITVFDANSEFSTRNHRLQVRPAYTEKISIKVIPGTILITYPAFIPVETNEVQSAVRKGIEEALRIEAKRYLPDRVDQLAVLNGFSYGQVSVKNTKTRWGSCSFRNNINLSLHLMRLPDPLVDYIILHELVHTRVKNHSSQFWQHLETVCPEARSLDAQVNQWSLTLY